MPSPSRTNPDSTRPGTSSPGKKFSGVRAARLSLLLAIGLTAGIGTAIYGPLELKQNRVVQTAPLAASQVTPDSSLATGASSIDPDSGNPDVGAASGQDLNASSADQQSFFGSASASSLNTVPQVVQTTQAPVLTTTQGS